MSSGGVFVGERKGISWKDRTLASVSAPPLPLMVFFTLYIVLMYYTTISEHKESIERSKNTFRVFLFLVPLIGILIFNMSQRWWWRETVRVPSPVVDAVAEEDGFPWGLLLFVVLLLVLVHYESYFRSSWFI